MNIQQVPIISFISNYIYLILYFSYNVLFDIAPFLYIEKNKNK